MLSCSTKNQRKSAFTLMEISVVLIVIGILALMIAKGSSIITSSRISAARGVTGSSSINSISGITAWYETSMKDSFLKNQIVDTSQISEWRDISPNSLGTDNNKLTRSASNAVIYRVDGINKIPSVQFSASGSFSLMAFYQGPSLQNTIFAVIQPTSTPNATAMTFIDGATNNASLSIKNNAATINLGSIVDTGNGSNPASFSANYSYIIAAYYNGNNSKIFVNDSDISAGNSELSAGNNMLSGLTLGASKDGSSNFNGLISEIIIFNRILSVSERKMVMGYLSKKYNIQVVGI